ncbi:MAG: PHP domain-containing protein [bacterium]
MIKNSRRFEQMIQEGRYLFHFHTLYTDGVSSLADYCAVAKDLGFQSLILTEHVRRECRYDFKALLRDIAECQETFGLPILAGIEAKVLPEGILDVPDVLIECIQVLGIAVHSFPGDAFQLAQTLVRVFKDVSNLEVTKVWLHPGVHALERDLEALGYFEDLIQCALENKVFIEFNVKHQVPSTSVKKILPTNRVIVGIDAHSVDEVATYAGTVLEWQRKLKEQKTSWWLEL